MSDLTDLARTIPCAYCGAKPAEPCVSRRAFTRAMERDIAIKHYGPSGRSSYPHSARTRPVWAIWEAGYREGQRTRPDERGAES